MKALFLSVVEISLSTSLVIAMVLALSSLLNRRYAAKWKYFIWLALALRLAVPFTLELPKQEIVLDVPARMTAPIAFTVVNKAPLPLQPQLPQTPKIAPLDIVAWVWLAGAVVFLTMHLLAYFRYRRQVLKNGVPQRNEAFLSQLHSLCRDLKLRGNIPVMVYEKAVSPMVLGFFQPILVFPAGEYAGEDLFFVLKHELIHLKRRDVFGKFLLVLANAIHWFNPLVYLMQREAVVDMELSCDERVVQGTPFAGRRAYTETLLSTISRRYQKTIKFSTQFYGGKNIMKKRFKNILNRAKKRNGFLILAVTLTVTMVLGLLIGCSAQENKDDLKVGDSTPPVVESLPAKGIVRSTLNIRKEPNPGSDAVGVLEMDEEVEILEIQEDWGRIDQGWIHLDYVNMGTADASIDPSRWETKAATSVAMDFARARFQNDSDAMWQLLTASWEGMFWEITFDGTPVITDQVFAMQRPGDIPVYSTDSVSLASNHIPVGSTTTFSIGVKDDKDEDNLIVCLIREADGWKVYDFGYEIYEGFLQKQEEPAPPQDDTNLEDVPESEPAPMPTEATGAPDTTEMQAAGKVAFKFAMACFRNDTDTMRDLLGYEHDAALWTYALPEGSIETEVQMVAFQREGDVSLKSSDPVSIYSNPVPTGSTTTMGLPLKDRTDYFMVGMVREEDGWKVKDYSFPESGSPEETESQQIIRVANDFTIAFFALDTKTMLACLADPDSCDGGYTGPGLLEINAMKCLPVDGLLQTRNDGSLEVSVEFRETDYPDSFTYLTMSFIQKDGKWLIDWYGLEK